MYLVILCTLLKITNENPISQETTYKENEWFQYKFTKGYNFGKKGGSVCTKFEWRPNPSCKRNVTFHLNVFIDYLGVYILYGGRLALQDCSPLNTYLTDLFVCIFACCFHFGEKPIFSLGHAFPFLIPSHFSKYVPIKPILLQIRKKYILLP